MNKSLEFNPPYVVRRNKSWSHFVDNTRPLNPTVVIDYIILIIASLHEVSKIFKQRSDFSIYYDIDEHELCLEPQASERIENQHPKSNPRFKPLREIV